MKPLPQTGTSALLEALSPHLDDDWINDLFPRLRHQGRHRLFSPSQMFRVSLLSLLTPVHSFNLLVELLPENRAWRDFAHLRNKQEHPDAKMLHQFRRSLGPCQMRRINEHLLGPLLEGLDPLRQTIAIIDATDLPAAANSFKKKKTPAPARHNEQRWEPVPLKVGRVGGLLATKSTRSASGSGFPGKPFY